MPTVRPSPSRGLSATAVVTRALPYRRGHAGSLRSPSSCGLPDRRRLARGAGRLLGQAEEEVLERRSFGDERLDRDARLDERDRQRGGGVLAAVEPHAAVGGPPDV